MLAYYYKKSLLNLATKKAVATATVEWKKPFVTSHVRFNSSSSPYNKLPLERTATTAATTTTNTTTKSTEKNDQTTLEQQMTKKLPFMPVINIPENEFAHNSFFSLHRPLLGLSDTEERPFFSDRPTLTAEEAFQEKVDNDLEDYMMNLQPFVDPQSLSETLKPVVQKKTYLIENADGTSSSMTMDEHEASSILQELEESNDNSSNTVEEVVPVMISTSQQVPELEMHYMPESAEVLGYLTNIQSKISQDNAILSAQESRLKKTRILTNMNSNNNRRFNPRLRRYQQKWIK